MCSSSSHSPLLFLPLHFSSSMSLHPPECSSFSPPATVILLILLCFEGLLFLIFTSVMFGTQVHSICTDETVSDPFSDQQSSPFPPNLTPLPAAATLCFLTLAPLTFYFWFKLLTAKWCLSLCRFRIKCSKFPCNCLTENTVDKWVTAKKKETLVLRALKDSWCLTVQHSQCWWWDQYCCRATKC